MKRPDQPAISRRGREEVGMRGSSYGRGQMLPVASAEVANVDAPAGWAASEGKAPTDLVERGAAYLATLRDKLRRIDALADE